MLYGVDIDTAGTIGSSDIFRPFDTIPGKRQSLLAGGLLGLLSKLAVGAVKKAAPDIALAGYSLASKAALKEICTPSTLPFRAKMISKSTSKRKKTFKVYGFEGEVVYVIEAAGFLSKHSAEISSQDGNTIGHIGCYLTSEGYWKSYTLRFKDNTRQGVKLHPPVSKT